MTKLLFIFIATISSASAYSQVWVEIGVPSLVINRQAINRWIKPSMYQGLGAYGHLGYQIKSFHPNIRLYRAPSVSHSQSDNGIGLGISYLPEFEKIPWAMFEVGLYSMYLVRQDSDNRFYDWKTVIGYGEMGIGFVLTNHLAIRTAASLGFGKPRYTYGKRIRRYDNWIAFYPYMVSLGLRYNFNSK